MALFEDDQQVLLDTPYINADDILASAQQDDEKWDSIVRKHQNSNSSLVITNTRCYLRHEGLTARIFAANGQSKLL